MTIIYRGLLGDLNFLGATTQTLRVKPNNSTAQIRTGKDAIGDVAQAGC